MYPASFRKARRMRSGEGSRLPVLATLRVGLEARCTFGSADRLLARADRLLARRGTLLRTDAAATTDINLNLAAISSFPASGRSFHDVGQHAVIAVATGLAPNAAAAAVVVYVQICLSCHFTLQRVPGIVYDTRHPRKKDGYRRRYP